LTENNGSKEFPLGSAKAATVTVSADAKLAKNKQIIPARMTYRLRLISSSPLKHQNNAQ
jgi:hypothetical protein